MEWPVKRIEDLATFFGVAYGQIKEWRRNGMPCDVNESGSFKGADLQKVYKWKMQRATIGSSAEVLDRTKLAQLQKLNDEIQRGKRRDAIDEGATVDRDTFEA